MTSTNQVRLGRDGEVRAVRSNMVVLLCFIIVMIDGYDTIMPSFVAPLIARDYALGLSEIGRLFAIGYVGGIVGALGAGQLADRIGRKIVLWLLLILSGVATLLCAASTSYEMLLAFRFLAGVGLGGAIPSLISLTAEHSTVERRNAMVTLMYIGYPVGAVVGGLLTSFFLRFGWQSVFLGGGVAALLMAPLSILIPETFGASSESAAISPGAGKSVFGGFAQQFGEGRFGAAMMLWIGIFCMLLMAYLLVSWTPTIAVRAGFAPQTAALSGVVLSLGGIVGAMALGPIVNRRGPYLPAAVAIGVGAVAITLLGHSFSSTPLLMTMLFVVGLTAQGGQLVCPAMTADLFPPQVRGAGAGWASGVGRLGSIVGPIVGGALLAANIPLDWLFAAVAAPAAIAAVAFALAEWIRPGQESQTSGR